MILKKVLLCLILLCFCLPYSNYAQDLDGRVDLSFERIQGVDPKVFTSLKKSLNEFLNNRKWTEDQINPNEKIECSFFLNIIEKSGTNVFKANLTIQASRPVFNSSYKTATVNFQDKEFTFRYDESQPLNFSDQSVSGSDALVSNLTATFAYYIYFILGMDYDSFSPKGGNLYFKKAQNIVNNAPEEGKNIRGWKVSESNRNRYWLIDQVLNPKFNSFRTYWYQYHRKGLDLLAQEPETGLKAIFDGLPILTKVNQDNPSSILMQFFFNTKSDEYANLLQQVPPEEAKSYSDQLIKLDVINGEKYRKTFK